MIDEIIMMIRFRSPTVYEIAESLAKSERFSGFGFLNSVSTAGDEPFQQSWCRAVSEDVPQGLTSGDAELLSDIGRKLGTSDSESQINTLRLQQTELLSAISAAETDFTKKSKAVPFNGSSCRSVYINNAYLNRIFIFDLRRYGKRGRLNRGA